MQSCGATGSWCASAIVAIFFASEMPPHHETSSMAMPTAPRSNASRTPQRVAIVSLTVTGTTLRRTPLPRKIALTQAFAEFALPRFERGELRPVVDRVYPIEQAAEAHRTLESNSNAGKVVLSV